MINHMPCLLWRFLIALVPMCSPKQTCCVEVLHVAHNSWGPSQGPTIQPVHAHNTVPAVGQQGSCSSPHMTNSLVALTMLQHLQQCQRADVNLLCCVNLWGIARRSTLASAHASQHALDAIHCSFRGYVAAPRTGSGTAVSTAR